MKPTRILLCAGSLAAGAVAAWSVAEAGLRHQVREYGVPVLPAGAQGEIRVLHVSDIHLMPYQRPLRRFLRTLAERTDPHLVLVTGDMIASSPSIPAVLADLDDLLDRPGAFVFGSNDYFAPKFKNPLRYFRKIRRDINTSAVKTSTNVELAYGALAEALTARGWLDLTNTRGELAAGGMRFSLVGVDDPHLKYDRMPAATNERGDVHIGIAHAPYARVLDAFAADGCDLTVAGHTHGGQICVPGFGALVNNCDIPNWRASGLQGWPSLRPDGLVIEPRRLWARTPLPERKPSRMWLNISAGLGTSPFTPVRFACPPEVTLLRLTHRTDFQA